MSLEILRADALSATVDGFRLRLALPWIRSLPLSAVSGLEVTLDGIPACRLRILLGSRTFPLAELTSLPDWWYLQDRLVVVAETVLADGPHDVAVSFSLLIPYLPAGPDAPLVLSFGEACHLVLDEREPRATASRDVT